MRAIVGLAMHTGIAASAWLDEDDRTITTALHIWADEIKAQQRAAK